MNSRPEQNFRLQSDEKQPMPGTKILWMATKIVARLGAVMLQKINLECRVIRLPGEQNQVYGYGIEFYHWVLQCQTGAEAVEKSQD